MVDAFKKAALFTDLHFGKKNNDRQHLLDCSNYVDWFIKEAQKLDVDTIIFLGDWHDNRQNIQILTQNYSLLAMEKIANNFKKFYFIPGNHDLFYKDRRDISSIIIGKNIPNIEIIQNITTFNDITLCPWLLDDEWKQIPSLLKRSKYIFGHFEFPSFRMNSGGSVMQDHGKLHFLDFDHLEGYLFSGHFHSRQLKGRVLYIGNTFPMDFNDVNDDERGFTFLEWGKEPKLIKWNDAPQYRYYHASDILENPETLLNEKTCARITMDLDLEFEEIRFIKETFMERFGCRFLDFIPKNKEIDEEEFNVKDIQIKSVDQIVEEGISSFESNSIEKNLLLDIWKMLE